jgi:hypothetical protein
MEREHGGVMWAMFPGRPRPSTPTRLLSFDTGMGAWLRRSPRGWFRSALDQPVGPK